MRGSSAMTPNRDNNLDKLSELADWLEPGTGIPTIIPTKCRDSEDSGPGHFVRILRELMEPDRRPAIRVDQISRRFSQQNVARANWSRASKSCQVSCHFGRITHLCTP